MTIEIGLVFLIIAAALYLFASERLPLDITALLILVTVMAIPILFHSRWLVERGVDLRAAFPTVAEGLSGFSNTATVTVLCMFILSSGVQKAGLVHVLGKLMFPLMSGSELRQILILSLGVGLVSGLINNTAAVAMAIPLALDMAHRSGTPASRMLMPVSYFAMLGGTLTLIGTSTNILASSILRREESFGREIGMFEFSHLGLIVLGTGLVYFVVVGRWLMPKKDAESPAREVEERFVVELGVPAGSSLVGASFEQSQFPLHSGVEVVKIVRRDQSRIKHASTTAIEAGDVILARATLRQIMDLNRGATVNVLSEFGESRKVRKDGRLVPVLLRNRRVFRGRTAGAVDFWKRYRGRLIGLDAQSLSGRRLADEKLHVGEIVLMEISRTALSRLRRTTEVVVLAEHEDAFEPRRMWYAGLIVLGVVLTAALTPVPIVVAALAGVIAMVAAGCIERDDMYSGVAWEVIFLLAGVIPLGIAMTKSGAAAWLADLLASSATQWHPVFVLMALYGITTLMTELVSNNASVVVLVPVAVSIAQALELEPLPLVLAVMFGASTSFLTPVGYQTNTMIYGTGVYRFTDFARVGAPLNALLLVVTSVAIYLLWPMKT